MKVRSIQIRIGQQNQANKPIFLLSDGIITCGNFTYKGRYREKFKKYYDEILKCCSKKPQNGILDVSDSKYWNAMTIYDDYLVPKWQRIITVEKVLKLANETHIKEIIEDIKPEFKRALQSKWLKIFKKADKNDPNLAKNPWQIL